MARCNLNINGKVIASTRGETIMDAALGGGVFVPQDCCSGQCETCRVRVAWGTVDDKGTAYGDTVLACQATLTGDATVTFEEIPPASIIRGQVSEISSLSPDVLQVVIQLAEPMNIRPGQYVGVRFAGFPEREYSPTVRLNAEIGEAELILHIKRLPGGLVSSEFGRNILLNHPVRVRGPLGSAFLRERPAGGILMTSTGTGWAPIWSMARAACLTARRPELCIVVGARDPESLYMKPALDWLKQMGVSEIIVTARERAEGETRLGTPDAFLPELTSREVVYVAGASRLVNPVKERAAAAGARCYADPFTPSRHTPGITDRVAGFMLAVRRRPGLRLSV